MKKFNASLQLKNGNWYTVIQYKDGEDKWKQKWENTGLKERGNKKEANKILEERLKAWEENEKTKDEKLKKRIQPKQEDLNKANWLFSKYLESYVENKKDSLSPGVYNIYSGSYIKSFREYFDKLDLRLIDITHEEIKAYYEYSKNRKKIKNVTLKRYDCVMRPALREAFKAGIIPDNPYDFLPSMGKEKAPVNFYDGKELEVFFNKLKGHEFELAYKMLAYYGFRRSELLGLRWQSIDFEHDTITINHKILCVNKKVYLDDKLKTKSSFRTLPLILAIKHDLLEHKKKIEENKTFFGKEYDNVYLDYVFVNPDGRIVYPDWLSHSFSKFLKMNNLKHIRMHDLRHSCASLLLANGVQMKQIQDWLGHSNFSTTADVYSHLDFSSKVQSANTIQTALTFKNLNKVTDKNIEVQNYLLAAYEEMKKLGFQSLDEYFNHLQSELSKALASQKEEQKSKNNGFEM